MICRDGLVGVAGQTAPTNGLEPPLQTLYVVVNSCYEKKAGPYKSILLSLCSYAPDRILRSYKRSLNGFAAELSKEEAHKLSGL